LAIQSQINRQIANIDIGINERLDRGVSVEGFAAPKLLFGFLQVAVADIEPNRVTENKIGRAFGGNIFRFAADHDRELGLEVRLMFWKGDLDVALVTEQRARR